MLWHRHRGVAASPHSPRRIPVRIHVAGTRGKSTTTRLIAAGLRAGGRRVLAKTTGSEPRLILPDGREEDWPRRGPASIREQVRLPRARAQLGRRHDRGRMHGDPVRNSIWASETSSDRRPPRRSSPIRGPIISRTSARARGQRQALRWADLRQRPAGRQRAEAASPASCARAKARDTAVTIVDTAGLSPIDADRALALAVCAAHGVPAADREGPPMDGGRPIRQLPRAHARRSRASRFASPTRSPATTSNRSSCCGRPVGRRRAPGRAAQCATPTGRCERSASCTSWRRKRLMPLLFRAGDPLAAAPRPPRRLRARCGAAAARAHARQRLSTELAGPRHSGGVIWGVGNYQGFGARLVAALAGRSSTC